MSEPSIRVLQVTGIMNRGGAETMIMNLYRKIDRTKIQFDFVENSLDRAAYDDEIESLGGKIYRCPHFTGKNYFQYKKWWKEFFELHKGEYNIIHGHIGSTAAIYLKEAKRNGLFTIAHSHNTNSGLSLGSMMYRLMSFPVRYTSDYFFGCSDEAGIDRFGKRVFCSNRYKTFHNAIDTELFAYNEVEREKIRLEFGIKPDEIAIGHIGRFEIQKNHDFLVDIFISCLQQKNNCKLVLVGEGCLRKTIEDKVNSLKISKQVVFTGIRNDVNRIIQALDVFVFPSLFEGLPLTLVEAQSSGLQCVISDKVPVESILVEDLISVRRLDDAPQQWAETILTNAIKSRFDRSKEIQSKGYDISKTSKELMNFYINVGNCNGEKCKIKFK